MPQAVGVAPTQSRTEAWNKDLPRKHGVPIMGEKICKHSILFVRELYSAAFAARRV